MAMRLPYESDVIERDPAGRPTGRLSQPYVYFLNQISEVLGIIITPGGIAPSNAPYLVAVADALLTAARVVTDTASITWDMSTPGQAKANAAVSAFSLRGLRSAQPSAASVPAGALYFVTDEKVIERSTGAAWQAYSTAQATAGIAQIDLNGDIRATGAAASGIAFIGTLVSNSFSSNAIMRRARDGGGGAPAAVQSGDTIAAYATQGHDGTAYGPTNIAALLFNATENFAVGAKGCEAVIATTPNGSATRADRWAVSQAGDLVSRGGHFVEVAEMTAPAAGAANTARIFLEDDGAGKSRLMVQFATGAAIQLAVEP